MRRQFSAGPYGAAVGLFLAAVLALVAFHLVGVAYLRGFALDLGSLDFPTPLYVALVALWTPFGALAAILLALAFSQVVRLEPLSRRVRQLQVEWESLSDRRFLVWAMAAAFLIPFAIRQWLLHGAPLTDDESAYRFSAELLASGRLWVQSPPMKLFVDQNFMINDGRLYTAYFLGWPALLAPGVWIGATGIMNALYSAMTIPALVGALTHVVGRSWARAGVVLFLAAPFVQIAAATQLSHTTCLMALTWCLWIYLQIARDPSSLGRHIAFALAFGLAFFIRPQSALPIGGPLLVAWALAIWRLEPGPRARAVAAFLIPSGLCAALFLGVLWAQNGSPWKIGYARAAEYMIDNKFRFTTFTRVVFTPVPGFDFSHVGQAIARSAGGLFRLNADLFGWPSSFALMLFASPRVRGVGVLWAMVGFSLAFQLFQHDWGIDTFGPVHALELALPIVCLTIVGAQYSSRWSVSSGLGASLLTALIVTAWVGFVPARLQAVRQIAAHINIALRAPEKAGLTRAIIFAPQPFAPPCGGSPNHFVFFRPTNDPDLSNDILWVNDLGLDENRRFVGTIGANRAGYTMRWTAQCEVVLEPVGANTSREWPSTIRTTFLYGN
jgi:hypothetical protein